MANTDIMLYITTNANEPQKEPGVPWRIAQCRQDDLAPNSKRKNGHLPKKKDYFYCFTGGNTCFDDGDTDEVKNGDFEFTLNDGEKTVEIQVAQEMPPGAKDWEIDTVTLSGPLSVVGDPASALDRTKIEIKDDTTITGITSGRIGMVVRKEIGSSGNYDYLYVDPDWDNRH